jgi:hypothetical protein
LEIKETNKSRPLISSLIAELEKEDIRYKAENKAAVMSELKPQLLSTSTPLHKEIK